MSKYYSLFPYLFVAVINLYSVFKYIHNINCSPLLCEKTGAMALALPGLMAGWQADEIVLNS